MGKVAKCPTCGKIIAIVFPLHECSKKAAEAQKCMTLEDFKSLVQKLLIEGWKMTTPTPEIFEAADKHCNNAVCGACNHKGLSFFPLTGQPPRKRGDNLNYRAFAICSGCTLVLEISSVKGEKHEHVHF